jgi:hypothetical protein
MSESNILSDGVMKSLQRDKAVHERNIAEHRARIADIDAQLAAHEAAVYVREMPEPKLDIGTELVITPEFHRLLVNWRWLKGELDDWSVGSLLRIESIYPGGDTATVKHMGEGSITGGVPIAMAQDMRRAYLARERE